MGWRGRGEEKEEGEGKGRREGVAQGPAHARAGSGDKCHNLRAYGGPAASY